MLREVTKGKDCGLNVNKIGVVVYDQVVGQRVLGVHQFFFLIEYYFLYILLSCIYVFFTYLDVSLLQNYHSSHII
jgi:hypothetical protein